MNTHKSKKNKGYAATGVISIIVIGIIGGWGYLYYWIFTQANFPSIIGVIIVAITLLITGVIVAVAIQRIREIKEEKPDDFSKY